MGRGKRSAGRNRNQNGVRDGHGGGLSEALGAKSYKFAFVLELDQYEARPNLEPAAIGDGPGSNRLDCYESVTHLLDELFVFVYELSEASEEVSEWRAAELQHLWAKNAETVVVLARRG